MTEILKSVRCRNCKTLFQLPVIDDTADEKLVEQIKSVVQAPCPECGRLHSLVPSKGNELQIGTVSF